MQTPHPRRYSTGSRADTNFVSRLSLLRRSSLPRRPAAVVLVTAVAAVTALAVPQSDAGAALPPGKPHKKVCTKGPAKRAECHAEVITQADGVTPDGSTSRPAGSYGPAELKSAYA